MANDVRFQVKQELLDHNFARVNKPNPDSAQLPAVIELSSSDYDSFSDDGDEVRDSVKRSRDLSADVGNGKSKKKKVAGDLPVGFLDLLPSRRHPVGVSSTSMSNVGSIVMAPVEGSVKQFWKAGVMKPRRLLASGILVMVACIMSEYTPNFCIQMRPVISGFLELLQNF